MQKLIITSLCLFLFYMAPDIVMAKSVFHCTSSNNIFYDLDDDHIMLENETIGVMHDVKQKKLLHIGKFNRDEILTIYDNNRASLKAKIDYPERFYTLINKSDDRFYVKDDGKDISKWVMLIDDGNYPQMVRYHLLFPELNGGKYNCTRVN
jgi:hypothetical protein